MAEKPPAFVVPAGVSFQITDEGVNIENRGDIVLHTDFGRTLTRIVSHEGAIELHASATAGLLSARGGITVSGSLTADEVSSGGDVRIGGTGSVKKAVAGGAWHTSGATTATHLEAGAVAVEGDAHVDQLRSGGEVKVSGAFAGGTLRGGDVRIGGAVTARGIQGERSVSLAAGKVQIDAVIAPEVNLDARTAGRITVIECQNEVGPNAVKGGFRLADYEEMFGNPEQFLADRGLNALGAEAPAAAPPPAPAPAPKKAKAEPPPPPAPEPPPAPAPAPAPFVEPAADDSPTVITDVPAPTPTPVQMEIDEAEEDPSAPAGAKVPEHPLHPQLMDAVTKILECYGGTDVPPAVLHLRTLIDTHEYDQVRAEITTIWSDLLKFHQKKGMRIQHQVTTTFNTINSLVKKM